MFASISDSYMCSFNLLIDFSIQCVCAQRMHYIYTYTRLYTQLTKKAWGMFFYPRVNNKLLVLITKLNACSLQSLSCIYRLF